MRAISSSMDVHGVRYTDRIKKIERIRKATEVEKKEGVTSVGYYEKRGMTKEDKERKTSMTPQEAFRKEIAQMANSRVYEKLQNIKQEEKDVNKEELEETEQQEVR